MARAIPIILSAAAAVATIASGGLLGLPAFALLGTTITVGQVVGAALSVLATVAGAMLNKPPDAARQSIEAAVPRIDSKPPKRIAFGRYRFGARTVASFTDARDLYRAHLIASHRCSIGTWDLFIDDRKVDAWTGDPFDMSVGATITEPKVLEATTFWISGGDHTQPPQGWLDVGVIDASDRWDGLTMIWVKSAGVAAKDFNKMYPRGANREIQLLCEGGVWIDPVTQTEGYSATPAVIGYALLMHELGLGYHADDLDAQSFGDGAIIEQGQIPLADGGAHSRYEMHGVIDLTGDRGDFIANVENAAASEIVLQGGKWAYIPGVAQQSVMTLDQDRIAGPPALTLSGEPDETFNTVEGSFVDPTLFTTATNHRRQDAAALAEDGQERLMQPQHPHVKHPVQAQRIDSIAQKRSRRQRSISAAFAGRAVFLTKGDVVTTNFGLPFWEDGLAVVRKSKAEIGSNDGVPIETNALELIEYDPTDYDWSVSDETAYVAPVVGDTDIGAHDIPTDISVGWSGSGTTRAVELSVAHNAAAFSVEWEYSLNGGVDWVGLPEVVIHPIDPPSQLGPLAPLLPEEDPPTTTMRQEALPSGSSVRWRLRNTGGEKLNSDWAETPDYPVPGAQPIPEPSGSVASSTPTSIVTDWLIPNDARIDRLEIYRVPDQTEIDPLQGARIALLTVAPSTTEAYTDTPLTAGDYRYWARCYDGSQAGEWSDPVNQTI